MNRYKTLIALLALPLTVVSQRAMADEIEIGRAHV